VKPEPPEFPLSTRIFSSKQPDAQAGPAEKGAAGPEAGSGEDSSTTADLYEFKDDDDDEAHGRQKEFVLHKRSRKRHADSESNDAAADAVDSKKPRGGGTHVKSEQHDAASMAEHCPPPTSTADSQPPASQPSWRTNMDLVIDAVARGEFERGDDFDYYSSQNAGGKGRRGRGSSRDDAAAAAHKSVPASTAVCPTSSLPSMPVEAFSAGFPFPRSLSAVTSAALTADHCSSKLLLPGMPSPQQLQQYRLGPPGSLAATCKFHQLLPAANTSSC